MSTTEKIVAWKMLHPIYFTGYVAPRDWTWTKLKGEMLKKERAGWRVVPMTQEKLDQYLDSL